ncbi:hypothetical protein [Agrobacterium rosae]|nr:hypothetical protein [Agrobacterium rosae]
MGLRCPTPLTYLPAYKTVSEAGAGKSGIIKTLPDVASGVVSLK